MRQKTLIEALLDTDQDDFDYILEQVLSVKIAKAWGQMVSAVEKTNLTLERKRLFAEHLMQALIALEHEADAESLRYLFLSK